MTDATAPTGGHVGKLPILTKVAHGIGAGALGVKDNGFVGVRRNQRPNHRLCFRQLAVEMGAQASIYVRIGDSRVVMLFPNLAASRRFGLLKISLSNRNGDFDPDIDFLFSNAKLCSEF